jgi:hypothetical protein
LVELLARRGGVELSACCGDKVLALTDLALGSELSVDVLA